MASFDRIDRISQEVHKAIDSIIRDELNDPRIGGTWSIVRCEVTRDLRYCKVRVSILEEDLRKDMMKALQKASGFVRRELGRRWAFYMILWQCGLAWLAAFLVRCLGKLIGLN